MVKKSIPVNQIDFYPDQSFDCTLCGFCCNSFEISITPQEKERLMKFTLPDGSHPDESWFFPSKNREGFYAIVKRDDRCIFMRPEGGCVMHRTEGTPIKPLICQTFPLHVSPWRDGRFSAEYRFICPGVAKKGGTLLNDQTETMTNIAGPLCERMSINDVEYSPVNPAPLSTVRKVHEGIKRILHNESFPLKLRLYAVNKITDFHALRENRDAISEADKDFADDAIEFIDKASEMLEQELSGLKSSFAVKLDLRILTMGYLRDDNEETAKSPLARFKMLCSHSIFGAGGGDLRTINENAPSINGKAFTSSPCRFDLDEDALNLFYQYFFGKVDAMNFCGSNVHGYGYELGIKHMLLSAPVGFALAAAFAREKKASMIDYGCMLNSVRLLDLTFYRSPFFKLTLARNLIERLSIPANYGALLNLTIK